MKNSICNKRHAYRIKAIMASCVTIGLLGTFLQSTNAIASEIINQKSPEESTIQASADSSLQTWQNEKITNMQARSYIAALQPQGYGDFGEKFESTDVNDGTDAKMGLITFDLSHYSKAPKNARISLTYLGTAGPAKHNGTDTVKITAVDDTQCTNNASSCSTSEATWANRPRFDSSDGRIVIESAPFELKELQYKDNMSVTSSENVQLDVTKIVRDQFAKNNKKITFALGESKHIDVRFASTESISQLKGITQSMQPNMTITPSPEDYTLSVTLPTKTHYKQGEKLNLDGLEVRRVKTSDQTSKILSKNDYEIIGAGFDANDIGAHEITIIDKNYPQSHISFNIYTTYSNDNQDKNTELISKNDDCLWYKQPASQTKLYHGEGRVSQETNLWQQTTLPVGNGRIGGSIYGEVGKERITFNEETLWTGGPGSHGTYIGGNDESKGKNGKTLRDLNKQLENGAQTVNPSSLTGGFDSLQQGAYQNFGNIFVDYGFENNPSYKNYERDLNISQAIANVKFTRSNTVYTRQYFASHSNNVLVSRFNASGENKLNLTISFNPNNGYSKKDSSVSAKGDTIIVKGRLGNNGLIYNAQAKVVVDSGTIKTSNDGKLIVSGANTVTMYTSTATDYKQEYPNYRTKETPEQVDLRVHNAVQLAANKGFAEIKKDHIKDYQSFYNRLTLNINNQKNSKEFGTIPTDKLLEAYSNNIATKEQKSELEALIYQYGRYLAIGSSREDSQLPANLQGIWSSSAIDSSHNTVIPWGSDFHMNVNLQMNYWPTYSGNLAELSKPLITYIKGLVKPGRLTAKIYAGAETKNENTPIGDGEGFMAHTENTPYGWTTPGEAFSWGWSPAAVPWILQNVYDAYAYSGNLNQLKNDIYPLLKEESHLYLNYMLHKSSHKASDGSFRLTTGVAYSPEHGPEGTDGNTYESSLVWQMLKDTIDAANALNVDKDLVGNLDGCSPDNWKKNDDGSFVNANANRSWSCAKSLLKPIEIGKSGQIKEWYNEGEIGKTEDGRNIPGYQNNHRHMSHMLGLFPGDLITIDNSQYMQAAKKSMTLRGDDATGWGVGQRINSWARTGDGNHAYRLIENQIRNAMYANLFDVHPPFQIDGNFGNTSGVNEMLMQSNSTFIDTNGKSYSRYVNILPALPDAWENGSVKGLIARGNFQIDIAWSNGKADLVSIVSRNGGTVAIKITKSSSDIDKLEVREIDSKNADSISQGTKIPSKIVTNKNGEKLIVFSTLKGKKYTISKGNDGKRTEPVTPAPEPGPVTPEPPAPIVPAPAPQPPAPAPVVPPAPAPVVPAPTPTPVPDKTPAPQAPASSAPAAPAPKSVKSLEPSLKNTLTVGNNNVATAGVANKVILNVSDNEFIEKLKSDGVVYAYAYIYSNPRLLKSTDGSKYVTVRMVDGKPEFNALFPSDYSGKHTVVLVDETGKQIAWTNIVVKNETQNNNTNKTNQKKLKNNLTNTGVNVAIMTLCATFICLIAIGIKALRLKQNL